MTYTTVIFIILAASTGAWGLWCLMRRPGWLSIFLFASVLVICYFSTVELMGRPKPIQYETANYELAEVISYRFDYLKTIWIWVYIDGKTEPIVYSLPWSVETAESLQDAFDNRGVTDKVIAKEHQLNRLLDDADEHDPVFHAAPQKPDEPKNYLEFQRGPK